MKIPIVMHMHTPPTYEHTDTCIPTTYKCKNNNNNTNLSNKTKCPEHQTGKQFHGGKTSLVVLAGPPAVGTS